MAENEGLPQISEETVNVVEPFSNKLVGIPKSQLQDALDDDYRLATPEDISKFKREEKYGSDSQAWITAAEGAAQAATFGLSTGFETKVLGVDPEDIRAREEINPVAHGVGTAAGLVGSAFVPGGAASVMGKVGQVGAKVIGATGGATVASKIAEGAARGAFEMGLYQGGEEVAKLFKEDPEQSAATAVANIGISSVLGGLGGGALSALGAGVEKVIPKSWVSEVERPALEAGEFQAAVKHADNITPVEKENIIGNLMKRKENAKEIEEAAKAIGATPLEGMVLDHKIIHKAEDALLNGPPTVSSLARQKLYNDVYQKAELATAETLGAESQYSKAELGNIIKENLTKKIDEQAAPIEAAYNALKQKHQLIPIRDNPSEFMELAANSIPEFRRGSKDSSMKLLRDSLEEVKNLKTVDDLRAYKTELKGRLGHAATPNERRMMAQVRDVINDLEEKSIIQFAEKSAVSFEEKQALKSLLDQKKEADKLYKPFIEKVSTLSEGLGKGRITGKQDALDFINEHLTVEKIVEKLSTKKDSAFREFLSKEFPAEAQTIALYQKNLMREAATKDGVLNVNKIIKDFNKLEPEIQNQIFTKEEIIKLNQIKTVMESMPKSFNPSGTSHTSAMREFFEHPTGAMVANARDFAIEKFIKGVGDNAEMTIAKRLAQAAVKGEELLKKGTKAVFSRKNELPVIIAPVLSPQKREKVKKQVDEVSMNPEKILDRNSSPAIPKEYAQAFGQMSANAVSYLVSLKPNTDKMGPLDPPRVPSKDEEEKYNRAIDIAESPMIVLGRIKDGTLIPEDVKTLQTIYPKLYNRMAMQLTDQMTDALSQGDTIPYKTRITLSMFLAQPLDSTMRPESIQAMQPMANQAQGPQQAQPPGARPKSSMTALNKMPGTYQTPQQARTAQKMQG